MVRCSRCRFLFEAATHGLLPACAQCGGATVPVLKIEPAQEPAPSPRTMKFATVRR